MMTDNMLEGIKHFVMIVSHSYDSTNSCGQLIENALQTIIDTIGTEPKDSIAIGFDGDGTKKDGKPWDVAPRFAVNMVDRLNNHTTSAGEVKLLQATALENIRSKPASIYNVRNGSVLDPKGKVIEIVNTDKITQFKDNTNFFSFAYENASDPDRSTDTFTRNGTESLATSHLSYDIPFDTDRGFFRNGLPGVPTPWENCVCTKDGPYIEWGGYNNTINRFVGSTAVWEWLIREKMHTDVQVYLVVIWNDSNPDISKDKPFEKTISFKTYEAAKNGLFGQIKIHLHKIESVKNACDGLGKLTLRNLDKTYAVDSKIKQTSRCRVYKNKKEEMSRVHGIRRSRHRKPLDLWAW